MGAWGIKALERDEGLDVLDILKNEYVPEHPVMDLGEMIELMKAEVMLGSDFSQIDFLFDNTAMALAELYFQWKDTGLCFSTMGTVIGKRVFQRNQRIWMPMKPWKIRSWRNMT